MTDVLIRVNNTDEMGSPIQLSHRPGQNIAAPGAGEKYHIRNATLSNESATNGGWVRLNDEAGTLAYVDWMYVPPRTSLVVPLDITLDGDNSDVLEGQQINDMMGSPVNFTNKANGSTTTDGTTATTASWTSGGDSIYVASVMTTHATNAEQPTVTADTHTGITWTTLQSVQTWDGTARLTQFRAYTTGGNTTTTQFGTSGTMTGWAWCIDNLVFSENEGSSDVGALFACGTARYNTSASYVNVAATKMPAGGRYLSCVQSGGVSVSWNPWSAQWTERADQSINTPNASMGVAWTWAGGDYGAMGMSTAQTQRIGGLVCWQDRFTSQRTIFCTLNGVKET